MLIIILCKFLTASIGPIACSANMPPYLVEDACIKFGLVNTSKETVQTVQTCCILDWYACSTF